MVVVAVLLGFFIGGGPSLLSGGADEAVGERVVAATTSTTDATTTSVAQNGEPSGSSSTTTSTTTTVAVRPVSDVSVKVYNGSTKPGQAVRVGDRIKTAGYEVLTPGPSPSDPLESTVVHFVAGYEIEAAALAETLGLPTTAASPMPSPAPVKDVGAAHLVLIVADDLVVSA